MKSNVLAIRAITAEYATQLIQPFVRWGIVIIIVLLLAIALLAFQFSHWWWLLAIPIVILTITGTVLYVVSRLIITRLSPPLNLEQSQATVQFVIKAQTVTESMQTPYFLIVFYVVKDIVLRRKSGFVETLITDSKRLRPDFNKLRKLFEAPNK